MASVDRDGNHDAIGKLTWRDGPIGEGVLRELIVLGSARGDTESGGSDQEAREDSGTKRLGKGTTILQREDSNLSAAAVWFKPDAVPLEYNKMLIFRGFHGTGRLDE